MAEKRPSTTLLWLTIVAAPGALGLETGLRLLFFPDNFQLIRDFLNPMLTPVAWAFAAVAGLGAALGLFIQRRLIEKRIAKLPDEHNTHERRFQIAFGVFLLTTAVPQIPSIFATFCFTFGASLIPVLAAITLTSVGVVGQALRVPKLSA
ncbi:MAG: hypothetical protein KC619_00765 [Myxococcales bacterium]|nr:hypothetical protein [Myxococcales bacterium]